MSTRLNRGISKPPPLLIPRFKPIEKIFKSRKTVFLIRKKKAVLFQVQLWWGKVDSNHRRHCQQIYSLSPLATREFPHIQLRWSWWTDSNPRPADYKSAALPTELHQHLNRHRSFVSYAAPERLVIIAKHACFVKNIFQEKTKFLFCVFLYP